MQVSIEPYLLYSPLRLWSYALVTSFLTILKPLFGDSLEHRGVRHT
jgi:hypothetical protein